MTDLFDLAQARDQQFTDDALTRQRATRAPEPGQRRVGRKVHCIECGDPIQAERLRAKPDAARCMDCQVDHERQRRQEAVYGA
jgi:DnaK suppressor protein